MRVCGNWGYQRFFGFLVLLIFEIGFSFFWIPNLRFFFFGIHCSLYFFPVLIFVFRFLLIKKKCFFSFCYSLV